LTLILPLTDGVRIIDCHGHLGHFSQARVIPVDAAAMLAAMDRAGVERICLSSFLSIGPDCRTGNQMVAEAVAHYPDRFIGYAVVNPNRPEEIEPELDRCFETPGMRAIKLHPAFHQYPIDGPGYRTVFEYAAQHRLPVLNHEWGRPEFLERLSADRPEIRFIIAHTGFWNGRTSFAYAQVVSTRDNVFVDLAYSNIFHEALERLVVIVGASRIVFGSDFPLHDLAYQLGRVLFAKVSESDKRLILGGNMLRILSGY
jgi:predicted TIM-barrel fold metal-dependent hydrolase